MHVEFWAPHVEWSRDSPLVWDSSACFTKRPDGLWSQQRASAVPDIHGSYFYQRAGEHRSYLKLLLSVIGSVDTMGNHRQEEKRKRVVLSRVWLCNPMHCSLRGSSVYGAFRSWATICFSRGSSNPGIKPRFPVLQLDSCMAGRFFTNRATREARGEA